MLKLGDRSLRDIKAAGQLDLAHCLGVAQLVEPDLLERLGALGREAPFDA